ncbi:hypothetical protein H9X90_14615 [Faecalicatena contorta]|uniref:CD0519/CD1768 family membrane protein n=1 Tax=Clostridia TaxID=186801 RepID=UPI00051BD024|nr:MULTISPECIES: membrane protein [Clostridia]MBM6686707.1 hypothetical protein [Faecalicatena contorta]MBM6711962.1 hypothetical protein [Faecalicatena contorta]
MEKRFKKAVSAEAFIFLVIFLAIFGGLAAVMGGANMLQTLMNTAYALLIETVFNIMAIAVMAGALSGVLSEFGVIALINKAITPLMKPLYDLPGAASVGVMTTYLSDNPAILGLAEDTNFRKYFKKYQLPALTNLGTAFGMGLIVTTFMLGINLPGEKIGMAALVGNIGAIIGSVISVRIMMVFTKKEFGTTEYCIPTAEGESIDELLNRREIRNGRAGGRLLESLLDGGKNGVEVGMAIIPGVLVICTIVMMLTNGPSADGTYTGAAYEGVALLPWLGEKVDFILTPLFGFSDASAVAVPITALGAAGAAIGLVPDMASAGTIHANDIAVFTAMCMCWSGYLSTHVGMMSALKCPHMTGKAIVSHTIGGLCAGVAANFIFKLVTLIF